MARYEKQQLLLQRATADQPGVGCHLLLLLQLLSMTVRQEQREQLQGRHPAGLRLLLFAAKMRFLKKKYSAAASFLVAVLFAAAAAAGRCGERAAADGKQHVSR